MNLARKLLMVVAAAGLALGLGACEKGPMEKAGKSIDKAVDKTEDKIHDAVK